MRALDLVAHVDAAQVLLRVLLRKEAGRANLALVSGEKERPRKRSEGS